MLPVDVVYYLIDFAPLSFVAVSRATHRLCQGVQLMLPYHYRTGLSGFRCVGTGRGLVLNDCVLEGTFAECHLTKCTLLYSWLEPGMYNQCRFVGCISERNLVVIGGVMESCLVRNNRCGVTNSGKLLLENCLFVDNTVGNITLSLCETTILRCRSQQNQRFSVVVGTVVCDQIYPPVFLHRGGSITMAK